MLTQEEMDKIAAEERYRAQVRQTIQTPPQRRLTMLKIALIVFVGILIGIRLLGVLVSRPASGSDSPAPTYRPTLAYVPKSDILASGNIVVPHFGTSTYKITITPEMVSPVLSGKFIAAGGFGNDIEAIIASESDYLNWSNGHPARALWQTGKKTTDSFSVLLKPGTYYLVFNNKFSLLTDKNVAVTAQLDYQESRW